MDRKSFIARLIAVPAALLGIKVAVEAKPQHGSEYARNYARAIFQHWEKEKKQALDDLIVYGQAKVKMPDVNRDLLTKYPRTFEESYFPSHTVEEAYFHTEDGNVIHYYRGIEK